MTTIIRYKRKSSTSSTYSKLDACDRFLCTEKSAYQINFEKNKDITLCNHHYKELISNTEIRLHSKYTVVLEDDITNAILLETIETHEPKELKL